MGLLSVLGAIGGNLIAPGVGGAIGGALGGVIEGSDQARAAQAASAQTAAATDKAIALQREMWQAQQEQQRPWLQAGGAALNKLAGMVDYQRFGQDQFQADPGYAFRLAEGQKALDRQAAARGGLISGAALKAAQRYGQEMGSQEYTNAFNRYQQERQAALNPLQSLAGVGQTAANYLGTAGQQYGQNIGNALINQGYTAGNAGIAAANARASQYGNIGSALGQVPLNQWSSRGNSLGGYFGHPGTAWNYGTDLGSQQTNMLAAQEFGM